MLTAPRYKFPFFCHFSVTMVVLSAIATSCSVIYRFHQQKLLCRKYHMDIIRPSMSCLHIFHPLPLFCSFHTSLCLSCLSIYSAFVCIPFQVCNCLKTICFTSYPAQWLTLQVVCCVPTCTCYWELIQCDIVNMIHVSLMGCGLVRSCHYVHTSYLLF